MRKCDARAKKGKFGPAHFDQRQRSTGKARLVCRNIIVRPVSTQPENRRNLTFFFCASGTPDFLISYFRIFDAENTVVLCIASEQLI